MKCKTLPGLVDTLEKGDIRLITISTLRDPNYSIYSEYFPRELNYCGHKSEIEFSHPITDFRGEQNRKLTLKTGWFSGSFNRDPYWSQWIDNGEGHLLIGVKEFGFLGGVFEDYSASKLGKWQRLGIDGHRKILTALEDLYYQNEDVVIKKDFLSQESFK